MQTIFSLIGTEAMTFSQGHGKVIQYIFPDDSILFPTYLKFSKNVFKMRRKGHINSGGFVNLVVVVKNWKHVTPNRGGLTKTQVVCKFLWPWEH